MLLTCFSFFSPGTRGRVGAGRTGGGAVSYFDCLSDDSVATRMDVNYYILIRCKSSVPINRYMCLLKYTTQKGTVTTSGKALKMVLGTSSWYVFGGSASVLVCVWDFRLDFSPIILFLPCPGSMMLGLPFDSLDTHEQWHRKRTNTHTH